MTCVLSSPGPWNPFASSNTWSGTNGGSSISMSTSTSSERPHQGYASSESESRQHSSSSGKKRASRAGTRSVTTLSVAQLERKRANDREAQRAIRQRTKGHIDSLERNVNDLRVAHDASEKIVAVTQQRNRELEEENAYLRSKLGEAGYTLPLPLDNQRPTNHNILSVHPTSPASQARSSIPRSESTSTPRSDLSINTSQPALSRHTSWQHTPSSIGSSAAGTTPTLSAPGTMQIGSTLTTWRSHENSPSMQSSSGQMHDPSHVRVQASYGAGHQHDRPQWSGTSQPYSYQDQQRSQSFEPSTQPNAQYGQASIPNYVSGTNPQQPGFAATPSPQTEFQAIAVSSPGAYQHGFPPPAQYSMAGLQVSAAPSTPEYAPHQSHMQVPPLSASPYHPDQQYSQQQVQANMQFRDDSANRGYSLTHYPSG